MTRSYFIVQWGPNHEQVTIQDCVLDITKPLLMFPVFSFKQKPLKGTQTAVCNLNLEIVLCMCYDYILWEKNRTFI